MSHFRPSHRLVSLTLVLPALALSASPSGAAEREPLRFRGDGAGFFAACDPVSEWSEYRYEERKQGRLKWDEPVGEEPRNLVWKTVLPMWGNAQPLAVGGRLFVLHEMPYWDESAMGPSLVCLDPASGEERWSRELHHFALIPSREREEVAALWLAERRWVAAKWRLAWRMHLTAADDAATIAAIWEEAVALGITSPDDKRYGQKLGDHQMGDTGRFWKGTPEEVKQRRKRLADHNLWHPAWGELSPITPGRWMGETFATPCSDGEYLYVRTARHLLTCLDLDGEIRWQTFYTRAKGYCDFAPSPILVGNALIVYSSSNRGSDGVLCRAFDKTSGAQLWELPGKTADYALGTPVTATLASGRTVLFLPSGHVVDPGDGRVLCEVPCHMAGADNPVAHGDMVFLRNSQEGGGYGGEKRGIPEGLQAVRLVEDGARVTPEMLWRREDRDDLAFGPGQAYAGDLLFSATGDGVAALDPATGEVRGRGRCRSGCWNLSVAGGRLFVGDRRDARVTVLGADPELRTIAEQQVDRPRKIPADMWHYRNEKSNWGVVGKPFPLFFSGNRIFLRTWFAVYCIGDPQAPTRLSPRHR